MLLNWILVLVLSVDGIVIWSLYFMNFLAYYWQLYCLVCNLANLQLARLL